MPLQLPFDTSYLQLPDGFFTELRPSAVTSPSLVIVNEALAKDLGMDLSEMSDTYQAQLFAGNEIPPGATPFAQAYAGHQFGNFTILGDGRAILWGELICPDGSRVDIQWKGSGRTPYSRGGDGRAALGPMLREYLISEAMHALRIPTTRSLAVVRSGEPVYREQVLDGAILTRVAASHLRIGTFQYAVAMHGPEAVQQLLNYAVERHDPDLKEHPDKPLAFLRRVMERQVDLIVDWLRIGFIHGVMNTDNSSICGETIDYGPCAFLETYDPDTVFSSIDRAGRYAFGNQGAIIGWNLARLAETLLPLIDKKPERATERALEVLDTFESLLQQRWLDMMRKKLGLVEARDGDERLVEDFLNRTETEGVDYTNTFFDLSYGEGPAYVSAELRERIDAHPEARTVMQKHNPAVIPRNHRVEEALDAALDGDLAPFERLLTVLKTPYIYNASHSAYQEPRPPGLGPYRTFCGT